MGQRTVDKSYAYVTRSPSELLVFREPDRPDAGLQIPKGTVEPGEDPDRAVVRELREETGLDDHDGVDYLTTDEWEHPEKPKTYHRHFYHVEVTEPRDEWCHEVTGEGAEVGDEFVFSWENPASADLSRDMDRYTDQIAMVYSMPDDLR